MDNIIPSDSPIVMSDEEWGLSIESQFNNTIPANVRKDLIQDWLRLYLKCTFDPYNEDENLAYADPDHLEEYMIDSGNLDGFRVQYEDFMNRIKYYFHKYYSIELNDNVDFMTVYSLYMVFIVDSIESMARYIKMIYTLQLSANKLKTPPTPDAQKAQEAADASIKEALEEIDVPVDEGSGTEHIIDNSFEYSTVESVLTRGDFSFEEYIEKLMMFSPGNQYYESINGSVNALLWVDVEDPDIFGARVFSELDDVQVIEAVLREIPRVK